MGRVSSVFQLDQFGVCETLFSGININFYLDAFLNYHCILLAKQKRPICSGCHPIFSLKRKFLKGKHHWLMIRRLREGSSLKKLPSSESVCQDFNSQDWGKCTVWKRRSGRFLSAEATHAFIHGILVYVSLRFIPCSFSGLPGTVA